MPNPGAKKEMKIDIEIDPFAECGKEKDWALGIAEIKKKLKPIKFKDKAELDTRKWNDKKLEEEALQAVRMGLKIFSSRVKDAMKEAGGTMKGKKGAEEDGGKKKKKGSSPEEQAAETVIEEYESLCKEIEYGLDKWLEDLASGKADNAKNLKDCGRAFKAIEDADIGVVFSTPRDRAADALEKLAKGGRGGPDERAVNEAKEDLTEALEEFEEHSKVVADAIDTVLKAAKATKGNKEADAELQEFAKKVETGGKNMQQVVDDAAKLKKALEEAKKALDDGKTDAQTMRSHLQALQKLSGLDKSAKDAVDEAKTLAKAFKGIEKKLK